MPPTLVTRTYNPLPFQDLEPKRFEDLVRQMIYDFRPWRRLEATGRSGGDDGFDARGLEIVGSEAVPDESEAETEDAPLETLSSDRLWLIQCKREKAIAPKKLSAYLEEILLTPEEKLHGVIFAAACDFSKKARDTFFAWARTAGIAEAHIWGRGELEDMLYQPKNDNLLFAYFGISLTIRRRSQVTQLRAELAIKRRLKKTVLLSSAAILLRDPASPDYPYVEDGKRPSQWWVYCPEELSHYGLMLKIKWSYAYVDSVTGEWDAADALSSSPTYHPWSDKDTAELQVLENAARSIWDGLPDNNKGWLKLSGCVSLRNIIAIDEMGDDIFEGTHVYIPFNTKNGPFDVGLFNRLTTTSVYDSPIEPDPGKRIELFPPTTRKN